MPWTAADAHRHTHKAKSAKERALWSKVANAARRAGGSDASAIRRANAVIARLHKGGKS